MSAWCIASNDSEKGKNKKNTSLWEQIKQLYDACRAENPEKYKVRNADQMRGRWTRLNQNANKWVGAYREAWRHRTSGMSQKDIEKDAHKIYEASGNKFNDLIVFNEVMCKNEKWALQLGREITRSRPEGEVGDEESGGSTKRSRTTEEGEYCVHSNPGLTPLQKCTGVMRVLAYGTGVDAQDEYLRMSETVTRDALIQFVEGIILCFGGEYLRRPNEADLAVLLHVGEKHGFLGMIGSIDCMHWTWKNYPTAWAGQYAGRSGKPTIILDAVASSDLWIWLAFFGTPGTLNDINVLHRSPVFYDVLAGRAPNVSYVVNGREYNMTYYLTDGIYPSWVAFVKSITSPQLRKHKLFAERQEAARKDVERAFGVLQARFAFLRHPCLLWDKDTMGKVMNACIIMHNMIVEDERHTYLRYYDPSEFLNDRPTNRQRITSAADDDDQNFQYSTQRVADLSSYMTNRAQLRNREDHNTLKNDLMEHIWQKFGNDE